jgi:hypothetical protein
MEMKTRKNKNSSQKLKAVGDDSTTAKNTKTEGQTADE